MESKTATEERLGTDQGAPLGESPGPTGEPGEVEVEVEQKLRLSVTSMGGYWRVDVFGDGVNAYQTYDCKTPAELGGALANAYSAIRNLER